MNISTLCPRCGARLFQSDDPFDPPGSSFCLAGHTFYVVSKDIHLSSGRPARARPRKRQSDNPVYGHDAA